jgi:hypothetical protein
MQEKMIGSDDLLRLDAENRRDLGKYLVSVQKMDRLVEVLFNLNALETQEKRGKQGPIPCEIQCIKIGECILVGYPGEMFSQIAMDIKRQSPLKYTFVAGLSNGSIGYSPAPEDYDGECYEDCLSSLAPEWSGVYKKKVLAMLKMLCQP